MSAREEGESVVLPIGATTTKLPKMFQFVVGHFSFMSEVPGKWLHEELGPESQTRGTLTEGTVPSSDCCGCSCNNMLVVADCTAALVADCGVAGLCND